MSECETCGRKDEGHWIGCAEAASRLREPVTTSEYSWTGPGPQPDPLAEPMKELGFACTYGDCKAPRRSADKRVKFCTEHSDPKNRK